MNYLDKTVAEMRDEILSLLGSDDSEEIDDDVVREIDKILRENLLTSFKNGLESGKKPRKHFSRRK